MNIRYCNKCLFPETKPDLSSQLNLPYETEYKMALAMHKPNK